MSQIIKLAGVTYENRQSIISNLSMSDTIYIERDYFNKYDKNAIGVFTKSGDSIGWIPKELASSLASQIDEGIEFSSEISRVLGGNGFHYGIEISLNKKVQTEEQEDTYTEPSINNKRLKINEIEEMLSSFNTQTAEQSQRAEKSFNNSIKHSFEFNILEGKYDKLMTSINHYWLKLTEVRDFAEFCFQTGRFEDCYKSLNTLYYLAEQYYDVDMKNYSVENLDTFISFGYNVPLPSPEHGRYRQSYERHDESYPELDRVYFAVANNSIEILLKELENEINSSDSHVRAAATFCIGELYFINHKTKEAIELYQEAIQEDPSVGLYWGYTAQVLNREEVHPLITYRYIHKAESLDPNNPRWHMIKALLYLKIGLAEESTNLIVQYRNEVNIALELCRNEQKSLHSAIKDLSKLY